MSEKKLTPLQEIQQKAYKLAEEYNEKHSASMMVLIVDGDMTLGTLLSKGLK